MAQKKFCVALKQEWCKACGICIDLCPTKTITAAIDGKAQVTAEENCIGCRSCVIHCPDFCIKVEEK